MELVEAAAGVALALALALADALYHQPPMGCDGPVCVHHYRQSRRRSGVQQGEQWMLSLSIGSIWLTSR